VPRPVQVVVAHVVTRRTGARIRDTIAQDSAEGKREFLGTGPEDPEVCWEGPSPPLMCEEHSFQKWSFCQF
jgi:hypothetical protein